MSSASWNNPGRQKPGIVPVALVFSIAVLTAYATAAMAQDADDELDFAPPRFGFLIQTDFNAESQLVEDGFIVRTSRLSVAGTAGSRFRYFVQANLLTNRSILDTRLGVRLTRALDLEVGLVKSPFSTEFLRSRASLPLTERARVVVMLAPKRQIGATAITNVGETSIRGGVYNGNGQFNLTNDGPGFLTVGRVDHGIVLNDGDAHLRFAINAAYSRDHSAPVPGISLEFAGTRRIVGADAELTTGHFLVATELIAAR
ncbi:porin, partial [Bacteroidota bacterium]